MTILLSCRKIEEVNRDRGHRLTLKEVGIDCSRVPSIDHQFILTKAEAPVMSEWVWEMWCTNQSMRLTRTWHIYMKGVVYLIWSQQKYCHKENTFIDILNEPVVAVIMFKIQ